MIVPAENINILDMLYMYMYCTRISTLCIVLNSTVYTRLCIQCVYFGKSDKESAACIMFCFIVRSILLYSVVLSSDIVVARVVWADIKSNIIGLSSEAGRKSLLITSSRAAGEFNVLPFFSYWGNYETSRRAEPNPLGAARATPAVFLCLHTLYTRLFILALFLWYLCLRLCITLT